MIILWPIVNPTTSFYMFIITWFFQQEKKLINGIDSFHTNENFPGKKYENKIQIKTIVKNVLNFRTRDRNL
jgi:hypothetical protein